MQGSPRRGAPTDARWHDIRKVGVIGAGQMGNGIAHVCALAGYRRAAERRLGRPHQRRRSRPSTATWRARSPASASPRTSARRALTRIGAAETLDELGDCDLVIEAATEKEDVKRKIFAELCPRAEAGRDHRHQHVVDLDHAARRRRPTGRRRFIGIHFMNPVPLMELVELIRGIATDDETFEACQASSSRSSARPSRSPRISRPSSSTASCCR